MKKSKKLFGAVLFAALTLTPAVADYGRAIPEVVQRLTEMYGPATPPAAVIPTGQKDALAHLLALQRRHWAPAWVSGSFYDWRTVSRYRRQAGLHLGYDIALPAGTPVAAAWPGEVVAVVPWTSTEWGVTVRCADGTEVTYGHIAPSAYPGQKIAVGQILGSVASDHVDVKMRDRLGRYVPFGEGESGPVVAAPAAPAASRNSILTAWLVAKSSSDQAAEDLFLAENATNMWELERRSAERKIELLDGTLEQLRGADKDGLISKKRLEQLKAERSEAQRLLAAVREKKRATPGQLRQHHKVSLANLKAIESWAKAEGLSWSDVESLVAKTIKSDRKLQEKVGAGAVAQSGSLPSLEELRRKSEQGAARLVQLEALYEAGGLSRQEIEDQRLRQRLLEEEYNLRKRRASR